MLDSIEQTARDTTDLINQISNLMSEQKNIIRRKLPNIYSKDLLEIIFSNPYSKIDFLVDELEITRQTASKYLNNLEKINLMESVKIGREKYFINIQLWRLLEKDI